MCQARFLLMLPVLLLLGGCIAVEDFGPYWDSAKIDPTLEGTWKSEREGGLGATFTMVSPNLYEMQMGDEASPQFVRTLDVDGNTYLMVKTNEDSTGGTLIPYIIQEGWLILFAPDRDQASAFAKAYPNGPFIIARSSISLRQLTPETMKALAEVTAVTEYWKPMRRYQR